MGAWDDHRPKVMATLCCCTGLVLLIWSAVTFGGRLGDEVELWYNVPLCQTGNPKVWVSKKLDGTTTCPKAGSATWNVSEAVLAPVQKAFFHPDFKYTTFFFRTNGTDVWKAPSEVSVSLGGAYSAKSTSESSSASSGSSASSSRRLLKGGGFGGGRSGGRSGGYSGGYSGPSYRSRYGGTYSYWGYGTPLMHGRRARSSRGPAVEPLTVVNVYSEAPVLGARVSAYSSSFSSVSAGCTNEKTGCEYTLAAPLVKDELIVASWTTGSDMTSGTYALKVQAQLSYSLFRTQCVTASTTPVNSLKLPPPDPIVCSQVGTSPKVVPQPYPNLFVTFATDETSTASLIGYIFLPISCVIICFGTVCALAVKWTWCPSCGGGRGGGSYSSMGPVSLGGSEMTSNPLPGAAAATSVSIIQYPLPMAPGLAHRERDGDHRSMVTVPPGHVLVDLTDNDVTSLSGLERNPGLQVLILVNNDLSTLSYIHTAQLLQALDVSSNNLRSLTGLGNVPSLCYLKVASNDLTDLSGASLCPGLRYVCAAQNDMRSLNGIASFPGLTHVDFNNNELATCAGLQSCRYLTGIDLSQNNLTSADEIIQLCELPNLMVLDIRGNDFPAMEKQRIRDAFLASKPGCRLES